MKELVNQTYANGSISVEDAIYSVDQRGCVQVSIERHAQLLLSLSGFRFLREVAGQSSVAGGGGNLDGLITEVRRHGYTSGDLRRCADTMDIADGVTNTNHQVGGQSFANPPPLGTSIGRQGAAHGMKPSQPAVQTVMRISEQAPQGPPVPSGEPTIMRQASPQQRAQMYQQRQIQAQGGQGQGPQRVVQIPEGIRQNTARQSDPMLQQQQQPQQ